MPQEFINRYVKPYGRNIDTASLQSLIVNQMRSMEKIPEGIQEMVKAILKL